jgi:hypothetical protein
MVGIDRIDRCRLDLDLIESDFQLLGQQHGQRGHDPLSHLRAREPQLDTAIGM